MSSFSRLREQALAVRDQAQARWGRTTTIRERIQVRVRGGYRAGVWPLKPGLYIVAEMPENGADFGAVATVLAPLVIKTAAKAVRARLDNRTQEADPAEPGRGSALLSRWRSRRTPDWVDEADAPMVDGWLP